MRVGDKVRAFGRGGVGTVTALQPADAYDGPSATVRWGDTEQTVSWEDLRRRCGHCGGWHKVDQSCGCFDNGGQ